jgi:hypothetical protein
LIPHRKGKVGARLAHRNQGFEPKAGAKNEHCWLLGFDALRLLLYDTCTMADGETSYVAWANRVNGRWIVHHGLDQRARAYMNHLAKVDPERLERSCQFAHQLARQAAHEDPKPWFYAGLFSLATAEEAKQFLANHWFILSTIQSLTAEPCSATPAGDIGQAARDKISRIRQALSRLLASVQSR